MQLVTDYTSTIIQQNKRQRNATQHNTTQHQTTSQHNTTHYITLHHNIAQHNTTHQGQCCVLLEKTIGSSVISNYCHVSSSVTKAIITIIIIIIIIFLSVKTVAINFENDPRMCITPQLQPEAQHARSVTVYVPQNLDFRDTCLLMVDTFFHFNFN